MSITLLSHPDVGRIQPDLSASAVLTVDLAAVAANTAFLAARTRGALMAVVKADGFGHGAADVARTALANGATWLGVTSSEEGVSLRRSGLRAPILSWLNPAGADFASALRYDLDLAVPSRRHLDAIAAAARAGRADQGPARIHLHLDTGMARDGAAPYEWLALCQRARLAQQRGWVTVIGVMSHHGCADRIGDPRMKLARKAFEHGIATARAAGLRPAVRHLAATAATLTDPASHYDLSRVGAGLAGIDPTGTLINTDTGTATSTGTSTSTSTGTGTGTGTSTGGLRPALSLTAPVVSLRRVPAGTGVGYGHTHVTARATTLALLPLGYADGLPRTASGRAQVLLGGRRCPVVGAISMDQIVVDVGDAAVDVGDVAVIFGPGGQGSQGGQSGQGSQGRPSGQGEPTVREWAGWAGTIEHEIVTGLGPRIIRNVR